MANDDNASDRPRLAVFCGSRDGAIDDHRRLAVDLGNAMAARGVGLVYGGASIGLMGAIADAVLDGGGDVVGVIPEALFKREVKHTRLPTLIEAADMHDRKKQMYVRADAFCAIPGGLGTLDEVFEAATWTQIGLHGAPKRVYLLDRDGFWDPLDAMIDTMVAAGFVKPENRSIIVRASSIDEVLDAVVSPAGAS